MKKSWKIYSSKRSFRRWRHGQLENQKPWSYRYDKLYGVYNDLHYMDMLVIRSSQDTTCIYHSLYPDSFLLIIFNYLRIFYLHGNSTSFSLLTLSSLAVVTAYVVLRFVDHMWRYGVFSEWKKCSNNRKRLTSKKLPSYYYFWTFLASWNLGNAASININPAILVD